jgi:hypothetical protein
MNDSPALSIEYAAGSKGLLMGLLSGAKEVSLDLAVVDSVDLSGVQLLVATMREAAAQKKEVHLTGSLSASFRNFLSLAGITHGDCQTGEELESALKAVF